MAVERILEIGIVVKDVDKAAELFAEFLGGAVSEAETVDMYHVRIRYCTVGDIELELMEPTAEEGVIYDFLQKHGEGLHHIGLKVKDIEETLNILKQKGMKLIDETPRFVPSFYDRDLKIAFVHPSSFHRVMLELIEYVRE